MPDGYPTARTLLTEYRNLLLPVYEEVCGDDETYFQIEPDLDRFLLEKQVQSFVGAARQSPPAFSFFVKPLFLQFLGDGKKCHESSPSGLVWQAVNNLIARVLIEPEKVYDAWQRFMALFSRFNEELTFAIETSGIQNGNGRGPTLEQLRLILLAARRADFLAQRTSSILNDLLRSGARSRMGLGGVVTSAQKEVISELQEIASRIVNTIPSQLIQIRTTPSDLWVLLFRFHMALAEINNPLRWIENVYIKSRAAKVLGIQISTSGYIPPIRPADPQVVRDMIDRIILGESEKNSEQNRPHINFTWDDTHSGLIITIESGGSSRVIFIPVYQKTRFPNGGGLPQTPSGNGGSETKPGPNGYWRAESSVAGIFYPDEISSSAAIDPWANQIFAYEYELMTQGARNYFYYHDYQPPYSTQPQCRIMTFPPVSQPSSFAVLSGG